MKASEREQFGENSYFFLKEQYPQGDFPESSYILRESESVMPEGGEMTFAEQPTDDHY